ncbi:MAG: hypothetical protein ACLGG0_14065 [Bacteriovoracia bacterium]
MNGVDYSKALARERDNYQETIQKDRAQNKQYLAEEENRHKSIQKKQYNNFEKNRTELEKDYQANISNVKERTQESIEQQKERFHKMNKADKERFLSERATMRKDFDGRFRDIKDSYTRAFEGEKKINEEVSSERSARYHKNVDRITKDKDKSIRTFQEKMSGSGADIRDQNKREKEKLVRSHETHLEGIYKDEAQKRFMLKEGLQKDLERTKAAHAAEAEQSQSYLSDKVKTLSGNFNERAAKMSTDYDKKNSEFVEAQARENFQNNKKHGAELGEVRRSYEKNLRNIDIDRRRRDNGSGEFAEVVKRQQGLKDDQVFEDRIDKLSKNLVQTRRDYNNRLENESEAYKDAIHVESAEAASRLERKERELTADKIVHVANEREKAQQLHSTQSASQHAERQRYENQIVNERNQAGGQVKKLKENYNKSLQDLAAKNEKFVVELKDQTDKDKATFITMNNQQRNEEILDLRRNFNNLMDTTVGNYETRLAASNRENAQLRDELDQKVGFVMAEADRQLKQQQQIYEDKRQADAKSNQMLMDQRENNLRNKILEVSNSYSRKMDQQTYNSEMKLKGTVSDYENRIKMMEVSQNKALAEKEALHKNEMKSLKSALEQEKAQLISQYENEINQLKLSQKQQIDQLNDYKRMG